MAASDHQEMRGGGEYGRGRSHHRAHGRESRRVRPLTGVFIAAGSNVEPERHLACAARELCEVFGRGGGSFGDLKVNSLSDAQEFRPPQGRPSCPEVRFSPWYRNRAAGFTGGDFI